MAIKTVVCEICRATVSKRSTLNLQELGLRPRGRGCRSHKEVLERQSEFKAKAMEHAERFNLYQMAAQVSKGVSMARAYLFVHPDELVVAFAGLRRAGFTVEEMRAVAAEVDRLYDTPLSMPEQEMTRDILEMERKSA